MKHVGVISVVLVMLLLLQGTIAAAAVPQRHNQELNVSGRVLDAHTVIVDENDVILEIASNTENDVQPRIFLFEPSADNELPLSDNVYEQYRLLVPEGTSRPGILYKYGDPQPVWTPLSKSAPLKTAWTPLNLQLVSSDIVKR
jgi:hypothetical protein